MSEDNKHTADADTLQDNQHEADDTADDIIEEGNPNKSPQNFTLLSAGALLLLGGIWGSAFLFIKWAVDPDDPEKHKSIKPFTLVALRLLSGGTLMSMLTVTVCAVYPSLRHHVRDNLTLKNIGKVAVMGFFNNAVPFSLVAWSETRINSGVASILDSTIPLFSLIFAHFLLHGERITVTKVVGLVIGFAGVVACCVQQAVADSGHGAWYKQLLFSLMVVGASASYAIASVFARGYLKHLHPLPVAMGQILCGAVYVTIASLVADCFINGEYYGFLAHVGPKGWIAVAYLGVISTIVAYLLYFYLISTVGSVRQTLVGYLLPVFGVMEGAIFLGDWKGLNPWWIVLEIAGAVMILAGIATVNLPGATIIDIVTLRRWLKKGGDKSSESDPLIDSEKNIQ